MLQTEAKFEAMDATISNVQAFLHKLENQVGELLKKNVEEPKKCEQVVEGPPGNDTEEEKSKEEKEVEEIVGAKNEEEVEKAHPITFEQAFYFEAD